MFLAKASDQSVCHSGQRPFRRDWLGSCRIILDQLHPWTGTKWTESLCVAAYSTSKRVDFFFLRQQQPATGRWCGALLLHHHHQQHHHCRTLVLVCLFGVQAKATTASIYTTTIVIQLFLTFRGHCTIERDTTDRKRPIDWNIFSDLLWSFCNRGGTNESLLTRNLGTNGTDTGRSRLTVCLIVEKVIQLLENN